MALVVDRFEPGAVDVRVDLRRGQVRMSEHLLDRPQVRAALDEVGGKRMAQLVRRGHPSNPRLERVPPKQLPKTLARERTPARGHEEGSRFLPSQQRVASAGEV